MTKSRKSPNLLWILSETYAAHAEEIFLIRTVFSGKIMSDWAEVARMGTLYFLEWFHQNCWWLISLSSMQGEGEDQCSADGTRIHRCSNFLCKMTHYLLLLTYLYTLNHLDFVQYLTPCKCYVQIVLTLNCLNNLPRKECCYVFSTDAITSL